MAFQTSYVHLSIANILQIEQISFFFKNIIAFRMLNEEELFRSEITIMCDLCVLFRTATRFDLRSNFHALKVKLFPVPAISCYISHSYKPRIH